YRARPRAARKLARFRVLAGTWHTRAMQPALDLRGVPCPLSWARAKVHLETLARGDVIDVVLDDPIGARDLPRAAESAGHHVVHVASDAGAWRITIEV
ncbi:MAG: sulfurtransferase TusA family protein, partial [Candidatus Rokuibacteriota bacterium]